MSFNEWKEYKLGDLLDISSSKRSYAKEYVKYGIPFYRGKEIISFYTFDMIIDTLDKNLTLDMIKEWHGSLMYRTSLYDMGLAGVFKKYQNKILGADFETASPLEVEDKLKILIKDFNLLQKVTIEDIAKFHLEFELMHPFQDGNGRIGRFIYLKQLLDNRLSLKYMNGESAEEYKKALGVSSVDNIKPVVDYIENQRDFIVQNKNMF